MRERQFHAVRGGKQAQERLIIGQMQTWLRALQDPKLLLSGVWDDRSRSAMRAFRARMSLSPGDEIDRIAFDLARQLYQKPHSPLPPALSPIEPTAVLLPGSRGEAVILAQIALSRFLAAIDPNNDPPLPISGQYDDATANAVSRFRAAHLLPPGDSIDEQVWHRLLGSPMDFFE